MQTQPHAQRIEEGGPAGLCILVVEDDAADAYLIGRALARLPSVGEVARACDGVEALELVERKTVKPDLAFVDLHMPRKSGFNLLADFSDREDPTFPMVVLTSSTAPTDAIRSRLRGALRVVNKPDTVDELEAVLGATIEAVCPKPKHKPRPSPLERPDIIRAFGRDRD